jgi:hypothetical protein
MYRLLVNSTVLHYNNIEEIYKKGTLHMYIELTEKKRYPIWLWKKLRFVVDDMISIREDHKEQFIEIVGSKAERAKTERHYRPQKLPAAVCERYGLYMENYGSIFNKSTEELEIILEAIYFEMGPRWFKGGI